MGSRRLVRAAAFAVAVLVSAARVLHIEEFKEAHGRVASRLGIS